MSSAAPQLASARYGSLRRLGRSLTPLKLLSAAVAAFLAWIAIYPLASVVVRLFWDDGSLDLSPITETFSQHGIWRVIGNTIIVVGSSGAIALVVGAWLAWVNERTDARMGLLTEAMPLLPFLVPPIAGSIAWVMLLSPAAGFVNSGFRSLVGSNALDGPLTIYSWYGLILVYTIYQVPYAFMLASAGLRNMDPSLEEQSRVSGAGLLPTLRKVTLPGVRPSLAGAILLMVWSGFGLFSIPVIIGTGAGIDVLSVDIVRAVTNDGRMDIAVGLSLVVILFSGLAWFLQTRTLRKGLHATVGGRGHGARPVRLGVWRWPVRALVLLYLALTTVIPFLALVLVSLEGYWTPQVPWGQLNFDSYSNIWHDTTTRVSIEHSLELGLIGATVGMIAAALVALWVLRISPRFGRAVDFTIKFPSTLSHIVIAVGFVLTFAGPPFNLAGTMGILLLAYLALYMPQGAVAADAAVAQVGRELPEASYVSGAGELRTFVRIYLPLIVPGLVAGWAFLFVRMVGDLTASAILAGTDNIVVGPRILQIFSDSSYSDVAALATVLTLITALVVVIVLAFTRRRARWAATQRPVGTV